MVNYSEALDATFGALADPTRRAILAHLALSPESSVGDLARPFAMSLPAISKHLRVLEGAGLLARRRDGRVHHCHLVASPMKTAAEWMAHYREFWEARLDALERYLSETAKEEESWPLRQRNRNPRRSFASRGGSRRRAKKSSGHGRARKR
ncbi:MAG TPA: metalloregulator ArsR/SmtB family transcription factor [Thermoanaerobaculia bacterium]|jgi:DNA-binding transcriptional ArsR family regulator